MKDRRRGHRGVERLTWIPPGSDRPDLVAYLRLRPETDWKARLQLMRAIARYAQDAGYHVRRIVVVADGLHESSAVGEFVSELTAAHGPPVALIAGPAAAAIDAVQQLPAVRVITLSEPARLTLLPPEGSGC